VNAVLLHARYLAQMAFPYRLSIDYGFDQIPVVPFGLLGVLGAGAVMAGWLGVGAWLRRKGHVPAFAWGFTAAAFAVTGNLVVPIGTLFAERLAYLPLVGFCAACALACSALRPARWKQVAITIVLLTLAVRTGVRAADYRGMIRLTEATARASPRSVKALLNLGRVRLEIQHRPADAIEPLERALALWPEEPRAARLLAQARAAAGRTSGSLDGEE
jgi:hypothetical protein